MQLRADQLEAHLARGRLAPVYFISGDEPLQQLECGDQIRAAARAAGYAERLVLEVDKGFAWDTLRQALAERSLFGDRRFIELRMSAPRPGREGGKALAGAAAEVGAESLLLISAGRLDRAGLKTAWVKALDKAGALIRIWPIGPAQLPGWIQQRMRGLQKEISAEAARLIAERVEGNLLAARQELEKLALLIDKARIESADVLGAVADSARYEVFAMIESAFLGDARRALVMLHGLRREGAEPLALFGALLWEFRRACSMAAELEAGAAPGAIFARYRIWEQRQRAQGAVLKRHSARALQGLLKYCAAIDKTLKSSRREEGWDQLSTLLLAISGLHTARLQAGA